MHSSTYSQCNTLHDIMVAIPYVSIMHWLARRVLRDEICHISETVFLRDGLCEAEVFYFQGDFRLQPKHLKGMETDVSIMECIPDSSKLDNAIGDDSLLLSALRNDVKETSIETARSLKSIVTACLELKGNFPKIKPNCSYN